MSKRIIALASLLLVGTTACSVSGGHSDPNPYTHDTTISSERAGKTTNEPTLNLSWCTGKVQDDQSYYTRTVQFIDPTTKTGPSVHFTHEPVVFDSLAGCKRATEGRKMRSAFNKNFSLMADCSIGSNTTVKELDRRHRMLGMNSIHESHQPRKHCVSMYAKLTRPGLSILGNKRGASFDDTKAALGPHSQKVPFFFRR